MNQVGGVDGWGRGGEAPAPVAKAHNDRRLSSHLRSEIRLHKWSLSISYGTYVV